MARRFLFLLALALPCALLFHPFLLRGEIPINADWLNARHTPWRVESPGPEPRNGEFDDPILLQYPYRLHAMRRVLRGELPLWNPDLLCGLPSLADGISLPLSPSLPLDLLLPGPTAHAAAVLFALFLAGAAMALYLRGRRLPPEAVLLGAWAFMLNGFFAVWLEFRSSLGAFWPLPLVFWGVDRIGEGRRRAGLAAVALGQAAGLLGGMAQFSAYALLAAGVYALFVLGPPRRGPAPAASPVPPGGAPRGGLWTALLALALGVGLGAAQTLPLLALAPGSSRGADRYVGANALPPEAAAAYLLGDFFGNPGRPPGYRGGLLFPALGTYISLGVAYAGAAAVPLAVAALLVRRGRAASAHALYGLGPALFLLLMNVKFFSGAVRALFPFLDAVHGLRMQALAGVALPVLMAEGLAAWREGALGRRFALAWLGALAGLAAFLLLAPGRLGLYVSLLARETGGAGAGRAAALFSAEMGLGLLFGAASAAALLFQGRPRAAAGAFLAVALADLLWFAAGYSPFAAPGRVLPETPSIRALADLLDSEDRAGNPARFMGVDPSEGDRWKGDALPPATALAYGLRDFRGKYGFLPERHFRFMRKAEGDDSAPFYASVHLRRWNTPLVDLAGVRFLLSEEALADPADPGRLTLVRDGAMKIYRNERALGRVFGVGAARVAGDEETLASIAAPGFDPRALVYLDRELLVPPVGARPSAAPRPRARVAIYEPERVIFETDAPYPAWFVLTDSWTADWEAAVDDVPVPVARADYLFRAVRVPPGPHRVEMAYRPRAFRFGLAVSALSLAALALVLSRARNF